MSLAARKQEDPQYPERNPGVLPETGGMPMYDLIELMFFAYREFVGDADRMLATAGFGRAHHRLLHFVARRPGVTIAELLEILGITKQSLNRVLKQLVDKDHIEVRPGMRDRRTRQLYPTLRGKTLALEAAVLQSQRFARVFASLPKGARLQARAFLLSMVDPAKQDQIAAMISAGSQQHGRGLES